MGTEKYNFEKLEDFFNKQVYPIDIAECLDELVLDYLMKSLECQIESKFHTSTDVNSCVGIIVELSKIIREIGTKNR